MSTNLYPPSFHHTRIDWTTLFANEIMANGKDFLSYLNQIGDEKQKLNMKLLLLFFN